MRVLCIYIKVVMPVKYKGILKIIFGIYTRCLQITFKNLSVDNECKRQLLSLIYPYNSFEER